MWINYAKERFGYESLEEEWGFLLFTVAPPLLAVQELYVKPEFRKNKNALDLLNRVSKIGKERGCTHLWTQVWMNDKGRSRTMTAGLAYGFQMIEASNGRIIMTKEIEGD